MDTAAENNNHGVVVGVDGSPESRAALARAVREARLRHVPLTAVAAWLPLSATPLAGAGTVTDDTAAREAAVTHYLDEAFESLGDVSDVDVRREVVMAPAAAVLLERAAHADLVVVGSRGLGGFGQLLLGSVSRQIASHAACPVMVVRPPADEDDAHPGGRPEPGSEAGRVVVGVDTSHSASGALELAFASADRYGVGLTAVHTWDPAYIDPGMTGTPAAMMFADVDDDEVRATDQILARWRSRYPDVDVRQRVVSGRPAPELIECSRGAELLVVGSCGRGGFVGLLLGSVSHAVLHHAQCAVVVVRNHD